MRKQETRAIAVVGVGAVLPDAPDALTFWDNCKQGRYSISEVPRERWDPELYWDPDPKAPDKTYSKIGGWVREYEWEPLKWRLPLPPKVAAAMDRTQKWAVAAARQALLDYGHPERPLDTQRTAVILGNAMAGEQHYRTVLRISFPEYARELEEASSFAALPAEVRTRMLEELHAGIGRQLPEITEDTMPGELANITAGRIANLFDFHGPNFVCDAACASAMAAMGAAIAGLEEHDFDAVVTGGIDANMSASTYTKFCKIGALSATGTRPYAAGADGFVMGEGAAVFVLRRLADAERDGDRIYAVIRGLAGSSDGRGKGITAPNPVGQRLAVERAWRNAGITPNRATLIEGHGTSTRVGDVVEVESLGEVFRHYGFDSGSLPLGSVKSNIGHLKGAAGAAGMLKAVFALDEQQLPPSLGFERPNPNIDFDRSPFYVNRELEPWRAQGNDLRRAAVSAFGFGGTNFHLVLEEYVPGRSSAGTGEQVSVGAVAQPGSGPTLTARPPLRGALLLGADDEAGLRDRLQEVWRAAEAGSAPAPAAPDAADLGAPVRLSIDYGDAGELATKAKRALAAFASAKPKTWAVLAAQGIFRGGGAPDKVAFLYTGQGSQYVNMMRALRHREPLVAEVFSEADAIMEPLLGQPLSELIFVDEDDQEMVAEARAQLRQTAITQPAVLTVDVAMTRLLAAYGIEPDMVMGHSLGEYGALVAAGALDFGDALVAVSARGNEMTRVSVEDCGKMAAVFAPLERIQRVIESVDGYVVVANINSTRQAVIGGASAAVERAMELMQQADIDVRPLPVSHAFHTAIVAPAAAPLRRLLQRLGLRPPRVPTIANVTGGFYPGSPDAMPQIIDLLGEQIASPVQFIKGLESLYAAGARVFVEVGPKRALHGFVLDVLGERAGVRSLFTNHPRLGDEKAFNCALCGLWAAGHGAAVESRGPRQTVTTAPPPAAHPPAAPAPSMAPTGGLHRLTGAPPQPIGAAIDARTGPGDDPRLRQVGELIAQALAKGFELYSGGGSGDGTPSPDRPVVVTGAALGLPGSEQVFDDGNVGRILAGEQFIGPIPQALREGMVRRNVTRLIKNERGDGHFETIGDVSEVIKLAARRRRFDLGEEFGYPADRLAALDITSQLAIGAGLDALRDAGLPLAMQYRTTTTGTLLPERWLLPEALRDETGVIFASAFPGIDSFADESRRYYIDLARRERLAELEELRAGVSGTDSDLAADLDRRLAALRAELEEDGYTFNRRFLFRLLAMGHSQFAELIGARGPNTQINSACASTTMAVGMAEDWIRQGRCRRVVIVSGDDVTSDNVMEWIGAGFLASGAAAVDERVEDAAIPFDRRRHGMLVGMGAAAMVVESAEAAAERGIRPIAEVLATESANSAYHGTRLDVEHICGVMESLVASAERKWGIDRRQIAGETVFVSHETYTPARGGSAQAEVDALRHAFGTDADRIVVANTKGFTGHPMGVGIEDVVALKVLETGQVPPVANFRDVDPDLGRLNLSRGGNYPARYALRLGAGFGSQISLTLMRWVPTPDGGRPRADALGYASRIAEPAAWQAWLSRVGDGAGLEVVHRTLRLKDGKAAARRPAPTAQAPLPEHVPAPAAPAAAAAEPAPDPVQEKVLQIVADKTGYPPEMLDLDLDLEADLGVDTVKQAETFAAIREQWGIPRDDDLALRDYPTLAHAIQFVYDKRPDLERPTATSQAAAPAEPTAAAAPAPAAAAPAPTDPVQEKVLQIVADKTGYPPEMLDLDLDLEADLGVDTVKQAETFAAIRAAWDIPRDDDLALRDYPTLGHTIQFVYDKRPDLERPSAASRAAAPAEPTATAAPAAAPAPTDPVQEKVLQIVADKTGYPPEMLDLDLDLEADLGVDTVKQAETFAAIRAAWDIPRDDELALRDYPTLAHAIQFVYDKRPDLRREAPDESPATTPQAAAPGAAEAAPAVADEAEPGIYRRVPAAILRPPLELCVDTGATLEAGARVVLRADKGGVAQALRGRLEKMGVEVLALEGDEPETVTTQLGQWLESGTIRGVYWLPALDRAPELTEMTGEDWQAAIAARLKLLYTTTRALYDTLGEAGTFLVSATRLGGRHGYDEEGAWAPLGGAVTGFTKTFKRERPGALVKAVDFGPGRKTAALADRLIDETLRDPGVVEVGYRHGRRWTIGLEEQQTSEPVAGMELDGDSVFLITGAAGSIVSAIVADLAAASGGTFHLLDIAPEPDPDDGDLRRFAEDREGLKQELFERIRSSGERPTPVKVERLLAGLERQQAALAAIQAVQLADGRAVYHSVNLLDGQAVAEAVQSIRERHDRIDVVLHAAGLEVSHMLPDKEPAEFDRVFDVKAEGYFHLLRALGETPLGAVVAFSSIAGRFGNAGQTDYAAANDLLCKLCSSLRNRRDGTRGVAIDWTAWGEIGMATRGSIPTMMAAAGIDMLPPQIGIPVVRQELTAGGSGGEVVIGQRLGGLLDEWHDSGGLDAQRIADRAGGLLSGEIRGMGLHTGLTVETELVPAEQPFLHDHQIDGTPVLPGVMGVEAFVEAARLLHPDLHLGAVEDVRFHAPFKFYRHEPRTVTVQAQFRLEGDDVVADCRLLGSRLLPKQPRPIVTEHFTARVRLSREAPSPEELSWPEEGDRVPVGKEEIYRIFFHGPAYQVLERAWTVGGAAAGLLPAGLLAGHAPAEMETATSPRLLELCFQTAGIWELGRAGRYGLPAAIARVSWLRSPGESNGRLCAVVRPGIEEGTFDARVIDDAGAVLVIVEGYRTIELPVTLAEEQLAPVRVAME